MFCTNCGSPLDEDAKFCSACGEPAARVQTAEKPSPAQNTIDTQRMRKGHGFGAAGLVLGIIAVALSLAFTPLVLRTFAGVTDTMAGEEWAIAFFTGFLYSFFMMTAKASAFIVPGTLIRLTGLVLATVGKVRYKNKKLSTAAIIVNCAGFLLQIIIIAVCAGVAGPRPIA